MDNHRTCNELFLQAVANKYSILFEKLERAVFDEFIHEDPDPNGDYLHNTEHFDGFVKEHEIKEVNAGIVVLYLKGVRLAVEQQELVDAFYELEEDAELKDAIMGFVCFVLGLASSILFGVAVALKK